MNKIIKKLINCQYCEAQPALFLGKKKFKFPKNGKFFCEDCVFSYQDDFLDQRFPLFLNFIDCSLQFSDLNQEKQEEITTKILEIYFDEISYI